MKLPRALSRSRIQSPPGMIGPDAVEVFPRRIHVGDAWCETVVVTGYPREVGAGWLTPLLTAPGAVDVSVHVEPVGNDQAAGHLRRQLARLESTRRIDARRERLADPGLDAAAGDAADLAGQLARGEGRLFRVGLYVTTRAASEAELDAAVHRVRTVCASMLLQTRPVTFRAAHGWFSTLPLGLDVLKLRRTFDTRALAAAFPFASAEIESDGGILYGRNTSTGGLVFVDRFSLENHNQVVLARSGAGKSYLAKLQILRSLYAGIDVLVIDPENEYVRLANAVGGTAVTLGAPGVCLNPLELSDPASPTGLQEQILFLHTFVASLIGALSPLQRAVLDRTAVATYASAGISADPATHVRPAPLLRDLVTALRADADGQPLATRLEPYATGSHRGLFDGPTSVRPNGHLVVFCIRDLPDELRAAGTLVALDAIWRRVSHGERRRRVVVVDEAWLLLRSGGQDGARFMQRLAKSARKYWCGLTTITQDVADVVGSDLGQSVITNASHHVLLGQSPQAMEALTAAFGLTSGEGSHLLTCDRGEGLVILGTQRAGVRVLASAREHALATSSPAELAAMGQAQ